MHSVLLGVAVSIAAIAIPVAPAEAQHRSGLSVHSGASSFDRDFRRDHRDGRRDRDDRRRDRGDRFTYFGDREYQGDTVWRADSFNDWWHERPHRSYPRWVQKNKNCERMWQGGGTWRCSW